MQDSRDTLSPSCPSQYSGVPPQSVLVPALGLCFCPCLHAQVSMKQGLSPGVPGKAPSMVLINGRVY